MTRRKPEFQTLDPSTWPTVAWTEFDTTVREFICTRTTAIEQYARGVAIKEIEQTTGIDRRQLYRLPLVLESPCRLAVRTGQPTV
nr:hypothetical protein [Burkholderia ubonensis]